MRLIRIGNIYGNQFGSGYAGNVWDKEGLSPAIMTAQGGAREPMIIEYETQNDNGQGEDGDAVTHNRQERQSHL